MQSPFRFPGSKQNLIDYIAGIVKQNLLFRCDFYETHSGGASLSLGLLERGVIARTTLIERDPLIYAFWKSVTHKSEDLCARIGRLVPSLKTWQEQQKYLQRGAERTYSMVEMGAACLFLNRTSFSGILGAGPIGGKKQSSDYPIGCRFNKDRLVSQIRQIAKYRNLITAVFSDAVSYLVSRRGRLEKGSCLVYLDPPYFLQGRRLYRYHYELADHQRLSATACDLPCPWIVSYDDHATIRQLFAKQKIVPIFLNYAVKQSRKVQELLISNIHLSQPHYDSSTRKEGTETQQTLQGCQAEDRRQTAMNPANLSGHRVIRNSGSGARLIPAR